MLMADCSHLVTYLVPSRQTGIPWSRGVRSISVAHSGRNRNPRGCTEGQVLHTLLEGRERLYREPVGHFLNPCIGYLWLTPDSFSYYELYLSVSQLVKNFRIRRQQYAPYSFDACVHSRSAGSRPRIDLPDRREWVAAVLEEELLVTMEPRA